MGIICRFLKIFLVHPKWILKVLLLCSTILVICFGIEVPKRAKEKWEDPRFNFGTIEALLHIKDLLTYRDYNIVLPIVVTSFATCIVGWVGAVLDNMILYQIVLYLTLQCVRCGPVHSYAGSRLLYIWFMYICFVGMLLFTLITYGGDHRTLLWFVENYLAEAWYRGIKYYVRNPKLFTFAVDFQWQFECCGLRDKSDWNWTDGKVYWPGKYPPGCCSYYKGPFIEKCTPGNLHKIGCYSKVRLEYGKLLTPVREAYFLYCFALINAALWGTVLALSVLQSWPRPPGSHENLAPSAAAVEHRIQEKLDEAIETAITEPSTEDREHRKERHHRRERDEEGRAERHHRRE